MQWVSELQGNRRNTVQEKFEGIEKYLEKL